MIVFRVDWRRFVSRPLSITALSAAFVFSVSFECSAQTSQPLKLSPVRKPATEAPTPPTPQPKNQIIASPVDVEVDNLRVVDPDEAGILTQEAGALGVGMWASVERAFVERLFEHLPVGAPSTVMRDLLRRLLLSPARMPKGEKGTVPLIQRRIRKLMTMGDLDGAGELLATLSAAARSGPLVEAEADLRFLSNDNARACALANREMPVNPNPYWERATIFCQILAGNYDRAALGVSLLRETGDADEAFLALADAMISGEQVEVAGLSDPTPLHLAMARVAKVQLPGDIIAANNPSVLKAIAMSPNVSKGMRLEAAEQADSAGALPVDALRQLYTSVEFSERDLANPLSRAEVEFGPTVRALLFRTSLVQTVPVAQAEAAGRALALAREEGRYGSMVKIFEPVLARIPPSNDLLWFAPEAVRAHLVLGQQERAKSWLQLLRSSSLVNPENARALDRLKPIVWLFGLSEGDEAAERAATVWWKASEGTEDRHDGALTLYHVFEALGPEMPRAAWENLIDAEHRTTAKIPSPAVWRRLQTIAETTDAPEPEKAVEVSSFDPSSFSLPASKLQSSLAKSSAKSLVSTAVTAAPLADVPIGNRGHIGEAVLLSLIALGEAGPARAEPFVLKEVLRALTAVGLADEARALAQEAVLARGI